MRTLQLSAVGRLQQAEAHVGMALTLTTSTNGQGQQHQQSQQNRMHPLQSSALEVGQL